MIVTLPSLFPWVGATGICSNCNTTVELDIHDRPREARTDNCPSNITIHMLLGKQYWVSECPICAGNHANQPILFSHSDDPKVQKK